MAPTQKQNESQHLEQLRNAYVFLRMPPTNIPKHADSHHKQRTISDNQTSQTSRQPLVPEKQPSSMKSPFLSTLPFSQKRNDAQRLKQLRNEYFSSRMPPTNNPNNADNHHEHGQHPITRRARPLGTLEPLKSNHQARKSSPSRLHSTSLRLISKPTTRIPQRIEAASKGTNDTRPISSYVDASAATPDESVDNI